MEGHAGASRVSSAKDKSEFIKRASVTYVHGIVTSASAPLMKTWVATGVDLAEETWAELKRRGHV